MRSFCILVVLLLCAGSLELCVSVKPARAEIMVERSLEWLCYDADLIVLGKIKSVRTKAKEGQRIEAVLELSPEKVLKKQGPVLKAGSENLSIYSSSIEAPDQMKVLKLEKSGHKVLAFLKSEGAVLKPDSDDSPFSIFDIENSATRSFSIDCDKVPADKLLQKTESSLLELKKLQEKVAGHKLEKHYKKAPYESEAGKALFSGSSTYLIVPSGLSPDSCPRFY